MRFLERPPGERWKDLAQAELALQDSPRTSRYIKSAVVKRWAKTTTDKQDRLAAYKELFKLEEENSLALVFTSFELIEDEEYELFREVIWNQTKGYRQSVPLLTYCDAIVKQKIGDTEGAKATAEAAFQLTENDLQFGNAFRRAEVRLQTARMLKQNEQVDMAIREYRRLLDTTNDYQMLTVKQDVARSLSEYLHDRSRDKEAAEVLEELVKAGKDQQYIDFSGHLSRMHYFWAEHYRQNGNREKQIESLDKAIEADPNDSDVLIALYRLPRADKQRRERTSELIRRSVQNYEKQIQELRSSGGFNQRGDIATALNQVAWLVGNTEGDMEKAVRQSRRSLELIPHSAASLDTLGRCYYAAGDLENAVRYQKRAVRLEPYQQQIVRQLVFFESELAKSK